MEKLYARGASYIIQVIPAMSSITSGMRLLLIGENMMTYFDISLIGVNYFCFILTFVSRSSEYMRLLQIYSVACVISISMTTNTLEENLFTFSVSLNPNIDIVF